ncbi:bifunctional diaminohydroxyphosphoribosylaminopyrimidine deaminase/5-amino-6-(5-phosphoribosylamino)uracil reductase RibD [Humidisolicoccus flavus]|uniref:bifunctional diaminohydroxyphosphoribosylaminopyrimidine deaminase/5-amino-6-(5-phosphoribosylamino)uracil reductase RibD n=1 Tax=Humidisolicoccus flavus TaxID=3111414 RepID=UPI003248B24A
MHDGTTAEHAAMRRAITLAQRGPERDVNPQVGCVILAADGTELSAGWHQGAGTDHAEVMALSQLAPGAAAGATAVVTLEPCAHTGRTGPCAKALIAAGVARVVYAVTDSGEHSSGGAALLRDAGVAVVGGVEREAATALIADWLFVQTTGRPRITVKWAQSLDGRAAANDGSSQWITGDAARAHVHEQRAAHHAIGVGTGTILADDPSLTARTPGARQPIPVAFGRREIPSSARLRQHPERLLLANRDDHDLAQSLRELTEAGIHSLYIEGGPTLASAFLQAGFVDSLHIYIAPTLLGGERLALGDLGVSTITQQLRLSIATLERIGEDFFIAAHPRKK